MFQKILDRPVLATVISIFITIAGVLGLLSLPITQYPDIAPPIVQISTTSPGANAATVLKSVIAPLEEQINGVEKMTYMTSSAGNDGSARCCRRRHSRRATGPPRDGPGRTAANPTSPVPWYPGPSRSRGCGYRRPRQCC